MSMVPFSSIAEAVGNLAHDHAQVVPISLFVAVLCLCLVIGHLLEENRWMNESIVAILVVSHKNSLFEYFFSPLSKSISIVYVLRAPLISRVFNCDCSRVTITVVWYGTMITWCDCGLVVACECGHYSPIWSITNNAVHNHCLIIYMMWLRSCCGHSGLTWLITDNVVRNHCLIIWYGLYFKTLYI